MTNEPIRILRLPKVLDRTGYCRSTIYRLMAEGTFPASVALGKRSMGFFEHEIDAWLAARVRRVIPATSSATAGSHA